MPTSHRIDIELAVDEQGRKVLVASGDVDLQTVEELKRRISSASEPGQDLVIDLRQVKFMTRPASGR